MYGFGFSILYLTPAWAAKLQTTSNCSVSNKSPKLILSTKSILENLNLLYLVL